jgi:methylated-DNA-[protein]-cysteine S-methyltransferase
MAACCSVFPTAFGWCGVVAGEKGLKRFILPYISREQVVSLVSGLAHERRRILSEAQKMVRDYFQGKKVTFDLPIDRSDFSPFQDRVYGVAMMIPYGAVKTYGEIAEVIGTPGAFRAVGSALGRNPLPLFIPCHRVIRGDGEMGGFSGPGGIVMKARLLRLEGVIIYPKTGQTFYGGRVCLITS